MEKNGSRLEPVHYSVQGNNILQIFTENFHKEDPVLFLDGTAGEGGHSLLFLKGFPNSKVILCDRDPVMLSRALARLVDFKERVVSIQTNFSEIDSNLLSSHGINDSPQGILLDLGISTFHLFHSGRGFSFKEAEPLDMRLTPNIGINAEDVINTYSKDRLMHIFYTYGEERWSKKIAEVIVERRKQNLISYTSELADLISKIIPRKLWPPGRHPATRIFQALRIEVNQELTHIEKGLDSLLNLLRPEGVIQVISFHSLEDRIVKNSLRNYAKQNGFELLTKKPILPSEEETKENPASRSAKLRVLRKTKSADKKYKKENSKEE
ncbi:16S rRNA (cytosine(1402)-N(4))-methyltransferase RsmH [Leptospira borgpetersenii serovar Hardjo-bovis]|uniref:Ribosomal RNA small subunit methyltransferase H n=1 Tax=Leptospira borgpetersenii serovar Hardjo-bovis str. Sponselee TaxID=1303729 RepID=M6BSI0_LEPBO|nr:16S rRNA (cytosine(1402)-N(4))-methyltransferase RsmH [Leptospira borgpetersenii]EMJ82722.1 16S rRNA (cytosine(1402)-N(4))-methyltransferase [Leptospira borgpetersenii serovar Hardjo-bovis str. Sponselee]MBE8349711.1 16S rRNA (cytosine(1402)-N(4))-methyltransferase RsmH [Leptospira borgpetersenii serovar Hardjo-bovis]MBE8360122.1 16S rRNA (cytosine(1402)-N(4))-methyltransferase RsmH [Leptospira borgpetersenii serovar Hardjo-bovis]MBE8362991.1 16S rRNA (cytosine(1402)-N(4))-methyltransferase 